MSNAMLFAFPSYKPYLKGVQVITCYLNYVIDPYKVAEFERYSKMWIPLVRKLGGQHHGYFFASEGANNIAIALFSFPSLAKYEEYRKASFKDAECQAAFRYAEETRCVVSCERSFMRPVFE
ncbi:NIPSNAP family protein [Alcanivorax xiamenensis]|uniref:NIPSNAP family protein n=1 Tax=Alcanivorax xiamenensis TaxID=1177156 RepID=UPI003F708A48